jgi:hypothetical protein
MLRMTRVLASSLALFLVAGAVAPATANAWPLGKGSHLHPASDPSKVAQISLLIHNRGEAAEEVKVSGQTYTVQPHASVTIKAPVGTQVYAGSAGTGFKSGDLLFSVSPEMKDATVSFN